MTVLVQTTPQSYRIQVAKTGLLVGTTYYVNEFVKDFNEWNWDHRNRRWVLVRKYRYYNPETGMCHIPRYDLPRFLTWLKERGIEYELKEVALSQGVPIELKMRPWFKPKDDLQAGAIEYLSTSDDQVMGLGMQTGRGKTATTIAVVARRQKRTMIILPDDTLLQQWKDAIYDFTEIEEGDIYVIQGAPSLIKLFNGINKRYNPKIILASIGTLRNWVSDKEATVNYPAFEEMCEFLGVGVRVVDEGHKNFHTNLMMDLRANAAVTIISTATFEVSKPEILRIFDQHYPVEMRYGTWDYKKYVDIFAYAYSSGYNVIPAHAYKSKEGYSHAKLEGWLLKNPSKLEVYWEEVISPIVHSHYINRAHAGKKMLLLASTVAMCEWIAKRLRKELQGYKVGVYVSESEKDMLTDSDFIVSTPGSAGTGTDIKGLLALLVTISIRSSQLNQQILGRLRELPDGMTPAMAYVYDMDIRQQVDHHKVREDIFKKLALNYHSVQL